MIGSRPTWAAYGGFNRTSFSQTVLSAYPDRHASPAARRLAAVLMLFFTGFSRFATDLRKTRLEYRQCTSQLETMIDGRHRGRYRHKLEDTLSELGELRCELVNSNANCRRVSNRNLTRSTPLAASR